MDREALSFMVVMNMWTADTIWTALQGWTKSSNRSKKNVFFVLFKTHNRRNLWNICMSSSESKCGRTWVALKSVICSGEPKKSTVPLKTIFLSAISLGNYRYAKTPNVFWSKLSGFPAFCLMFLGYWTQTCLTRDLWLYKMIVRVNPNPGGMYRQPFTSTS